MRDSPGFRNHDLAHGFRGAIFCQPRAAQASAEFVLQVQEIGRAAAHPRTDRPSADGCRPRQRRRQRKPKCRASSLPVHRVLPATKHMLAAFRVPRRMLVVAKHELGADARHFSCGLRCLHVAQVAEELHRSGQVFRDGRIGGPRASSSSTSRIWQREASSQQSASANGNVTPCRCP